MKTYLIIEDNPTGGVDINVMRQPTKAEIEADVAKYQPLSSKIMLVMEGQLMALMGEINQAQKAQQDSPSCLH